MRLERGRLKLDSWHVSQAAAAAGWLHGLLLKGVRLGTFLSHATSAIEVVSVGWLLRDKFTVQEPCYKLRLRVGDAVLVRDASLFIVHTKALFHNALYTSQFVL